MKKKINYADYAPQIIKALPAGCLLTTKKGEEVNTMIIGWGTLGICWGKQICSVFVRESRYTKSFLDANPEFTVNVPLEKPDPQVVKICGRLSGRDVDKFQEAGLTLAEPETVSVPGIREFPLTLECKVLYRQEQDPQAIPREIIDHHYAGGDYHTMYVAEIVDAYIIED